MTLHVHTARISYRGPDRFDVTRGSGGEKGHPFAPSWGLLKWVKVRRPVEAQGRAWAGYTSVYLTEMAESQKRHPDAWQALLARERVVLVCYCREREHCHRGLLARLLVEQGAVDEGEFGQLEMGL